MNTNNVKDIISGCSDDPTLIFPLITRGEIEIVDYLLEKNIVNINTCDVNGNDVIVRLLKANEYDLVLKYMKKRSWDVNHQNIMGDTFAHILAGYSDRATIKIIDSLLRKSNFLPNIVNNKRETILDRATNNSYLLVSLKIFEDKRFNNIDLYDFKNLFRLSIDNNKYGIYSKLNNFNILLKSLLKKDLQPNMRLLVDRINENRLAIKNDIKNNKLDIISSIINSTIEEVGV